MELHRNSHFNLKSGSYFGTIPKTFAVTEGTVKMTISRMRKRYREILRSEIAQTVTSVQEVEEELQHLISALQS